MASLTQSFHPLNFYLGVTSSLRKKHAGVNHIVPVTIKVAIANSCNAVELFIFLLVGEIRSNAFLFI